MSRVAPNNVAGAVPAHTVYGGSAAHNGRTMAPSGTIVKAGGVPWIGQCIGVLKSTGEACPNSPVEGEQFCVGHLRAQKRAEAASKKES